MKMYEAYDKLSYFFWNIDIESVFQKIVGIIMFLVLINILVAVISNFFEDFSMARRPIPPPQQKVENKISDKSKKRRSACIIAMQSAECLNDLDLLYKGAISGWPEWEGPLTKIYKKSKAKLQK